MSKLHEGKDLCLFYLMMYFKRLKQYLDAKQAFNKCWILMNKSMNEWISGWRPIFILMVEVLKVVMECVSKL